jgi:hypothetical protein
MKATIKVKQEVEIKWLSIKAGVRYWEDTTVNGKEDLDGELIPFRNGEYWEPLIDVDTGIIKDWPQGMKAEVHYKVCDDGEYRLLDANKKQVGETYTGYVPGCLSPLDDGFGDYIILSINENGKIDGWSPDIDGLINED